MASKGAPVLGMGPHLLTTVVTPAFPFSVQDAFEATMLIVGSGALRRSSSRAVAVAETADGFVVSTAVSPRTRWIDSGVPAPKSKVWPGVTLIVCGVPAVGNSVTLATAAWARG